MLGDSNSNNPQSVFNAAVITVALQVGCLTLVIIFASLILGLFLDQMFDTRPLFTILFLVGSMPATWIAVFWSVNRAKKRLKPPIDNQPTSVASGKSNLLEEDDSDD
jgi:F0F1-type ATP synthase assembly protein I